MVTSTRQTRRKTKSRSRPALTRERILETGLLLLERSPHADISMRSLAEELGSAPMSLYRHVRNREDLLDGINLLALKSIQLEIPLEGDWQSRTRIWMHSLRRELHAQPAVAPLLRLRGSLAPTLFQVLDELIRVMLDAGFEGRGAALACREVTWFTMSFVANEMSNQSFAETSRSLTGSGSASYSGSFDQLSSNDLTQTPELAALLPSFAEIEIDEIFSAATDHLLQGLAQSLDTAASGRRQK